MKTKNLGWIISWFVCLLLVLPVVVLAADKPGLTPQQSEITKTTLYEFRFSLQEPLLPQAALVFVFPEEFNLAHLRMAGSPQINGGFEVIMDGRTARIKRSGLGDKVAPDTDLTLLFGNIQNPSSPGIFSIESWIEGFPDGRSVSVFYDVRITEN